MQLVLDDLEECLGALCLRIIVNGKGIDFPDLLVETLL
jgi:hypothetical protein